MRQTQGEPEKVKVEVGLMKKYNVNGSEIDAVTVCHSGRMTINIGLIFGLTHLIVIIDSVERKLP